MTFRHLVGVFLAGSLVSSVLTQEPADVKSLVPDDHLLLVPQVRALGLESNSSEKTAVGRADLVKENKENFAEANLLAVVPPAVAVRRVAGDVQIQDQTAQTTLAIELHNQSRQPLPVFVCLPVPDRAKPITESKTLAVEEQNHVIPPQRAGAVWREMAQRQANPGALEFYGSAMLQTPPVTIPANGSQTVAVEYAQTLDADGVRCDYVCPRSESVRYDVPWSMELDIRAKQPIATVYSPSHKLTTKRLTPKHVQVTVDDQSASQPGPVWLSYLLDPGSLSATLFTQPDDSTPEADGTFLFLAGLPTQPADGQTIPREITLALDRSGSMQGPKITQVREAAWQVLSGLNAGESFNVIAYNDSVESLSETPLPKTPASLAAAKRFIEEMTPRGGTNLHAALLESIRPKPTPETLPIVLFLTDGLPTVGQTDEAAIRDVVAKQNTYDRRIFTVGVGVDVNTPLLETIATRTRARPTFVLPEENVETKVSQVFQGLEGPILAQPKLDVLNANGQPAGDRVSDVFPRPLPDLFKEDHLVVLGRYRGADPLTFRVSGNFLGTQKAFDFTFPLTNGSPSPFVARLWATRKIADLVNRIRASGANADPYVILNNAKQDPEVKALAGEILKLTTRYGIVTEYTAFLAEDGIDLTQRREVLDQAVKNFDERAVKTRVGLGSVNQSINNSAQQRQLYLNNANCYWDVHMKRVAVPNVQQWSHGASFRRGNTWVDGRLLEKQHLAPEQVVLFGSEAHTQLLKRLAKTGQHVPLSWGGDVLMEIDNQSVLVKGQAESGVRRAESLKASGASAR